jgi:hypothetical protein
LQVLVFGAGAPGARKDKVWNITESVSIRRQTYTTLTHVSTKLPPQPTDWAVHYTTYGDKSKGKTQQLV